jgi:hypothetical protein
MYTVTITADESATVPATYDEPTAAHMLRQALAAGFTLTADADTAAITLTRPGRTITLAPAEPLPAWTTSQRREVLTLAASHEPLTWKWGRANTPRLAHGSRWLASSTTGTLTRGGYLAPSNGNGTPAALSLRAYLTIGTRPSTRPKTVRDDTLAAMLRNVYRQPAPATT